MNSHLGVRWPCVLCGHPAIWQTSSVHEYPLCRRCRRDRATERDADRARRAAVDAGDVAAARAYRPGAASSDESALLGRAAARRRPRPCTLGDPAVVYAAWGRTEDTDRTIRRARRRCAS